MSVGHEHGTGDITLFCCVASSRVRRDGAEFTFSHPPPRAIKSSFEPTKTLRAQYVDEFGGRLVAVEESEVAMEV